MDILLKGYFERYKQINSLENFQGGKFYPQRLPCFFFDFRQSIDRQEIIF